MKLHFLAILAAYGVSNCISLYTNQLAPYRWCTQYSTGNPHFPRTFSLEPILDWVDLSDMYWMQCCSMSSADRVVFAQLYIVVSLSGYLFQRLVLTSSMSVPRSHQISSSLLKSKLQSLYLPVWWSCFLDVLSFISPGSYPQVLSVVGLHQAWGNLLFFVYFSKVIYLPQHL